MPCEDEYNMSIIRTKKITREEDHLGCLNVGRLPVRMK